MKEVDPEELVGDGKELGERFDYFTGEKIKERKPIIVEINPPKLKWYYL